MPINFTDKEIKYLSTLYQHELHNSYVYSKISNFLNVNGYKNLSDYYEKWSQHEIEHSIMVRKFCNDNSITIEMNAPIDGLNIDLNTESITEFANVTVDVEKETSDMYNVLLEMGEEDGNGFIKKFAHTFLEEQIEETDKASTISDNMKNIGDNRALLQIFDSNFEAGE